MSDNSSSSTKAAPGQRRSTAQGIRQYAGRAAVLVSVALALATVLAWGARLHWALDLFSHFPVQVAGASLVPLAILLGLGRWKAALLPAAVVAANAALIVPLYLPATQPSCSAPTVRAVSANVLVQNRQFARFVEYIRAARPDFFAVMEVDAAWLAALEPLRGEYPHQVARLHQGAFGIALFSRVPIEEHQIVESAVAGVPMIHARLVFGDRRLTVVAAHPLPPVRKGPATLRNGQLKEMAPLLARQPDPRLLIGDLNTTSWSPHFRDLVRDGRLRDARQGIGIQPTWPGRSGVGCLLQIPIDHTLVSDDVEVVSRKVGPDVGSDHRPVEIELRFSRQ
ncbi:MAG: endonuclease/exonuclease/phosphatase family protein [Thermoguttaceae bacterium]